MKLTEKQAFKVINYILSWLEVDDSDVSKEEVADFVMTDLINLELNEGGCN